MASNDQITVGIPVGPLERHRARLDGAIESALNQTKPPYEVLLYDNGTGLAEPLEDRWVGDSRVRLMRAPWAVGLANGFNALVGLSHTDYVVFLGSDDRLRPRALELAQEALNRWEHQIGMYHFACEYSNGFQQNTPCLAAMVSKKLWRLSGGFELGSDYGHNSNGIATSSCEIAFVSKLMIAGGSLGNLFEISKEILYEVWIWNPGSIGIGGVS